jgi:FixJ family two-component response regulator
MSSLISVVDDDVSVRVATDNLLSSHGYLVRTFGSAEEFLRSPHLHDCACVITDVQMPGMDGFGLLADMRAHGHLVPVIFITAFSEEGVRASALKAGAICLLAKPFAASTLIDCVKTALHRAGH